MKRRAPPKCLDIPRARIPLRFFLLTPGALSLCPQILKEKEMREREREREERCSGDSAYSRSKLALGKDDDLE